MDYLESERKALELAMQNEKMAYEFYEKAMNTSTSELSRITFRFLSKQELEHFDMLKKMKEDRFSFDAHYETDENAVKEFFNKRAKYKDKIMDMSELEAYKMGMELEQKSYDFYKKAAETAQSEKMKKFLRFLMEWES